ncbi:serine/threonine-protein kinase [Acetobacter fallax]|uniref:Protein kinase domain-containing protein n=1 Tax=Acetobacter fallax TaxID=1737473 RepID=A0ABX0KB68_9PROT|nr:hypothetical protein [Acetobacter fallax]NHO32276.1 hypothetical protein [Acetobacter fallax]NHO35836.1 hypothetical protein [Acetobacter fallax]
MAEADFAADAEHSAERKSDRVTIGERYVIEMTHALPELAGCPACVAHDTLSAHSGVIALAPDAFHPVRPNAQKMARIRSPHLLTVHALDEATGSVWLICDAPPGPALTENSNWSEAAVLERVIEPIAAALHTYKESGFTHRAIRPDNVFDPGGRFSVRLGPGLATPPAIFQPDRFEALSSVVCAPATRGNGTIADDVFSLGALAAWLLGGGKPYGSEQPGALTEERMAKGSFTVLAGHLSLSPDVMSLLAAMLSDDPSARPAPRDLLNAADRKGFVARRQVVASMPVQLGPVRVRTARELAWHATRYQTEFTGLFRRGVVERWLSHELGLTQVASRLSVIAKEGAVSADSSLSPYSMMEIIAVLDPFLPMFWDGLWFWPDAIGTLAVAAASEASAFPVDPATAIVAITQGGKLARFAQLSGVEGQVAACQQVQLATRQATIEGPSDVIRLAYLLNPYQACLSSRCVEKRFSTAWALLQWLNAGENVDKPGVSGLLDPYMMTFLFACSHRNGLIEYFDDIAARDNSPWASDLRILAKLQHLYATGPLSGIARQLLPHLSPSLKQWRSRTMRTRRGEDLATAADTGDLIKMFELLNDIKALAKDREAWLAAKREARTLELQQASLTPQSTDVPPKLRAEMFRVATAFGAVTAIASLCLEIVL